MFDFGGIPAARVGVWCDVPVQYKSSPPPEGTSAVTKRHNGYPATINSTAGTEETGEITHHGQPRARTPALSRAVIANAHRQPT